MLKLLKAVILLIILQAFALTWVTGVPHLVSAKSSILAFMAVPIGLLSTGLLVFLGQRVIQFKTKKEKN